MGTNDRARAGAGGRTSAGCLTAASCERQLVSAAQTSLGSAMPEVEAEAFTAGAPADGCVCPRGCVGKGPAGYLSSDQR